MPSDIARSFRWIAGLDVRDRSYQRTTKGIEIRMPFKRPGRGPMWIAGVSICVLAASGIVAIVRAIPASYASIPDERASSRQGVAAGGFENAQTDGPQARPAEARETINRRNRARCRDCGIVESMRQIERSSDVGRQDTVAVRIAGGAAAGASGSAIAARATTERDHESQSAFATAQRRYLTRQTPERGNWATG